MDVKKYLEAGKIVSVFGIKGEIKVQPWCDGPEFLCGFDTLYYKSGTPVEIERSRVAKNIVVMKVKGVDTVEELRSFATGCFISTVTMWSLMRAAILFRIL